MFNPPFRTTLFLYIGVTLLKKKWENRSEKFSMENNRTVRFTYVYFAQSQAGVIILFFCNYSLSDKLYILQYKVTPEYCHQTG